MSFEQQKELEATYVMPTFARKPVELVCGNAMMLEDSAGREYLDFLAGIGVVSLGHCHPAVTEALHHQAAKLLHVGNYYYVEGRGQLAQRLSNLLNAGAPEHREPWQTFFANSGAEANECAIKLARLHARKRAEATKSCAARIIVTLKGSFHGRTLATLAATAQPVKQEAFQPLPDGFEHVALNKCEELESLFALRGAEICAVMLECVQGEGGVHPCTQEFMQTARRLTQERGALLICDEVQTGIYRCGTPFAFQYFGVVPDIVTIAKGVASGMPTGMCAARAQVAATFEPGDHGSTFGGSCLAVAAANATLGVMEDPAFSAQVAEVGAYLRQRLAELEVVEEVRGLGLMVAADIKSSLNANEVVDAALGEGLLINATGPHTLRFLPPLVCEPLHIDELIERLTRVFSALVPR